MADSSVAITTGAGANIDTRTTTTTGDHRQVMVFGDPDTDAAVTPVLNTAPAGTEYAPVVRPIPSGVQTSILGSTTGKTVTMKTGTLASSATTANQVILTYTVTTGKTFYIQWLDCAARLTTYATTATNFGTFSLQINGTVMYTGMIANAGVISPPHYIAFTEPIFVASTIVVRIVCTPAAVTAFTWNANFGGYEI